MPRYLITEHDTYLRFDCCYKTIEEFDNIDQAIAYAKEIFGEIPDYQIDIKEVA